MQVGYLGVDIGSISTKGVIIDDNNCILAEKYLWTECDPLNAVKEVIKDLKSQIQDREIKIKATGATGSARKLIGSMINANVVKNEITAHAIGTISVFPDVRTIFEIGGQDSKMIILKDGIVTDYAMNTLCAAGTGSFLTSQTERLGLNIEEFGDMALKSQNPTKIAARCTVFAESDLVHKAQTGHRKEDIIAGLCMAVVTNYLNNVGKGKDIQAPIVFQGGVSKNAGVIKAFERATGESIYVDPNAHLMGALGVAILSKKSDEQQDFDFDITELTFETIGKECGNCANECEVIHFYRNKELIDVWGNRCERGGRLRE